MKKKIALFLSMIVLSSFNVSTVFAGEVTSNDAILQGVTSYVDEVYVNMDKKEKDKLTEKLYKEKTSAQKITNNSKKSNEDNKAITEAYNRVNQEEEYIVNLINSCGENTTLDNWKFNLDYLKNNYDSIKQINDVNLNYVDLYIEAYKLVSLNESMPDEKVSSEITMLATYNSGLAIDYATRYYSNYNSNYSNWSSYGGDCANFVSQCLYAGGKSMKGTPGSSSSSANFSNWFSSGSAANTSYVSSTWRGADAFRNYWQVNATSYKKFTSVSTSSWNYGYTGDAISLLNSNGRAYHTMIIVGYANPDFILAAHSSSTMTARLSSKADSNGFIIYNMR